MKQLFTTKDAQELLKGFEKYAMFGEGAKIEGSDFYELYIYILDDSYSDFIRKLFINALNVKTKYVGRTKAL